MLQSPKSSESRARTIAFDAVLENKSHVQQRRPDWRAQYQHLDKSNINPSAPIGKKGWQLDSKNRKGDRTEPGIQRDTQNQTSPHTANNPEKLQVPGHEVTDTPKTAQADPHKEMEGQGTS